MNTLHNTDLTGHFLIKNLETFIKDKLVSSPQKEVMQLLVKEVTKLFNGHMNNLDVIQYWEDQKNYEPNGDIKVEDKNVPKFFGGTKDGFRTIDSNIENEFRNIHQKTIKEYDPKIVFDPNCLGNHWEILR
ncbi:MAG: hypothetical protein CL756_05070 [Chloroflexi bacterium]|nr:hypothetical protein [Chloroflexota bacterium]|tara:strand:+ start:386 stop:778 length:393 start_codon:yes stop_codon:yes gene_type:complete